MKCLDVVKEDMQEVGAREDEAFNRSVRGLRWATPDGKAGKRRHYDYLNICRSHSDILTGALSFFDANCTT